MAGMLLRHNVFQFFLPFVTTAAVKEQGQVAEANKMGSFMSCVCLLSQTQMCPLYYASAKRVKLIFWVWDLRSTGIFSQRIVAVPYQNFHVKGFWFYVSSILFLKMILNKHRILYLFYSDFNDAFPSPGFTSEKWKSFRCILSFILFKTYTKHKSSCYFMDVNGFLLRCEADLTSQFWFVKEFSCSTMELLTQDFSRIVRRESSVNMASIERNVAFSLFSLFLLFQEITLQVRKACVCECWRFKLSHI